MCTNRREDLQRKTRERSIPDSGRLSMALQPAKFRTPDQSHQITGTAEIELKVSLKITETLRVWAGSTLKLC